jgi:hypothetical protein
MNITYKDFIGVYEDALSSQDCEFIIQSFEKQAANNSSTIKNNKEQFNSQEIGRMDYAIFAEHCLPVVCNTVNKTLDNCLHLYKEEFFYLKQIKAVSENVKLQRTPPRGGYHVWHCEADCRQNRDRVLVWMIYLNDIPDGEGETEFLWQGIRVKPKAGTCVIWPAQFTHPHRGNPVYSCDKYIATGWYTYTD